MCELLTREIQTKSINFAETHVSLITTKLLKQLMYTTLVKTYLVFLYPQPALLWLQPSYVQNIIHVCPTFIVSFILCLHYVELTMIYP
jgi:hypothetical protein